MRTTKAWSILLLTLLGILGSASAWAEKGVIRAQLAQSLPLIGVDRVHQELGITGRDVGIFVVDDWTLNEEGFVHGQAVVDVLQAVAPGARLWLCKLDFPKITEIDFALCLEKIVREHLPIRVVNMSFAVGDDLFDRPCGSINDSSLAQEMRQLSQMGVIFVAASGNDGRKNALRFPACLPEVISVGATYDLKGPVKFDNQQVYCEEVAAIDNVTCYSDAADFLDVVAPGSTISTPSARNFGGTSAAAPIVSGVVALMLQADPSLNERTVLEKLQATGARAYDPLASRTFPRVDAYRAVQASLAPSSPPTPPSSTVAQFDTNGNGRIEDSEFFAAVDEWIASQISDDLFFRLIDYWIAQTPVSASGRGFSQGGANIQLFDLQGRLIMDRAGVSASELRADTWTLANGVYIYVITHKVEGSAVRQMGKLVVLR